MTVTILPRLAPDPLLGVELIVDMSGMPLEKVAEHAPWKRLELPPMILRHPDLWHDGVWEE